MNVFQSTKKWVGSKECTRETTMCHIGKMAGVPTPQVREPWPAAGSGVGSELRDARCSTWNVEGTGRSLLSPSRETDRRRDWQRRGQKPCLGTGRGFMKEVAVRWGLNCVTLSCLPPP